MRLHHHTAARRLLPLLWALFLLAATFAAGAPAPRAQAAGARTYTVGWGETLFAVAYDHETTVATLRLLNGLEANAPAWVGMKLILPPEDGLMAVEAQAGDNPARVAAAHSIPVAELVELNGISPSQPLRAGTLLYVPTTPDALRADGLPIHEVQAGETLTGIAREYGVSARSLVALNDVANASAIRPGMKLAVPPLPLHVRLADAPAGEDGQHYHRLDEFPTLTDKWIDVDLSEQRVVAYEGVRPVRSFVVSTGKSATPTVTGIFRMWAKIPKQTMAGGSRAAGDYYLLPNVEWVQYFYRDYAFHGAYWHTDFGTPVSHGCVNLTNDDARWLYEWAKPDHGNTGWLFTKDQEQQGTLVVVHQ
jgi:LysM repeat protein